MVFALALADQKNSDILRPEKEKDCVQIYEEYANGGLDLVQSWIDRYSDLSVEDAVWRGLNTIGVKPTVSQKPTAEVVAVSIQRWRHARSCEPPSSDVWPAASPAPARRRPRSSA